MILSAFFDRFEVLVVKIWSTDFEKHRTPALLLMVDFLRIFKITQILEIFERFLKIIKSTW